MNEFDFSLDVFIEDIDVPRKKQLREANSIWNQIESMTNMFMYLEDIKSPGDHGKDRLADAIENTKDTTKKAAQIYDDTTDAGGAIMKSSYDLSTSILHVVAKALKFISKHLSAIPAMAARMINKSMKIPSDVLNKIRGNIQLFITVDDVVNFYNNHLGKLLNFIDLAKYISSGDKWGTMFNKDDGRDDMKTFNQMKSIYNHFGMLRFEKTTIEMRDRVIVDAYFSSESKIKFVDPVSNTRQEKSYLDALSAIAKTLKDREKDLDVVEKLVAEKISESRTNNSFAKLTATQREKIMFIVKMFAKIFSVIGRFISCGIYDLKTIDSNMDKILNKSGVTPVKAPNDIATKAQ